MLDKTDHKMTRRQLLKLSGGIAAGSLLAACAQVAPTAAPTAPTAPTAATATAPAAPTETSKPAEEVKPTESPATPAQAGQTTVTIMHQRNELSEEQQKQFETDNPDIKVEFLENDATKLFALYAAGTPPDLFRTQAPAIPQYLARKMLLDLSPYFQASSVLKMDDLAPANDYYKAASPTEIGKGSIYGMCKDWSPDFTVYAYTTAFEEAGVPVPDTAKPVSYDDIYALAKKLAKKDGEKIARFGYAYEAPWIDRIWMNALAENNQKLYSDDFTAMNLTQNDEAKRLAEYYYKLAEEDLVASPRNPSPSWIGEDFNKGITAMVQYGYWFSAMAESDITKGKTVLLPAPTWSGVRRDPTMTATGMVASSNTKVPDQAWKLFEWYNGLEPAKERAGSGWGVPALKSMYSLIPLSSDFQQQANKVLQDELKYSQATLQFNPYLGEAIVADSWAKNLAEALKGSIKFDEMLANIEREVNEAIQDGISRVQ